jgi:hypothetical protein
MAATTSGMPDTDAPKTTTAAGSALQVDVEDTTTLGDVIAAGAAALTGRPQLPRLPVPPVGAAEPLTAAYCAERAAYAIHWAEISSTADWLSVADQWRRLAEAMATSTALARPRDPNTDTRR